MAKVTKVAKVAKVTKVTKVTIVTILTFFKRQATICGELETNAGTSSTDPGWIFYFSFTSFVSDAFFVLFCIFIFVAVSFLFLL